MYARGFLIFSFHKNFVESNIRIFALTVEKREQMQSDCLITAVCSKAKLNRTANQVLRWTGIVDRADLSWEKVIEI